MPSACAVAGKMAEARFNTAEHTIFDYHVICLAGDGCMQEGVAMEAVEFAGHQKLDNLILIYDSNDVTLDAMANKTQSENAAARFKAIGWDVQTVDGQRHGRDSSRRSTRRRRPRAASRSSSSRGRSSARASRKSPAPRRRHGEGGAKFADAARKGLGLPGRTHFFVSDDVARVFRRAQEAAHPRLQEVAEDFRGLARGESRQGCAARIRATTQPSAADLLEKIPAFPGRRQDRHARRGSRCAPADRRGAAAAHLAAAPTCTARRSTTSHRDKDFDETNRAGRNIRFGIREHGMAAIINGIAYDGIFRASCATFLVFADYSRPSMRLAALSKLPVIYIYTHDSVGVGEDGPTHQPVETVSRAAPDPEFRRHPPGRSRGNRRRLCRRARAHRRPDAARAHRQAVPLLNDIPVADPPRWRAQGRVHRGEGNGAADAHPARLPAANCSTPIAAAKTLGAGVRVVSMPVLRALRPPTAGVRERGPPAVVPQARRDRSRRHAALAQVCRPRRQSRRHRSLRPQRSGQHSDEGTRHHRRFRGRGGAVAVTGKALQILAKAGPRGLPFFCVVPLRQLYKLERPFFAAYDTS